MYILELTDKYINVYNKNKKELSKEYIKDNIIKNNHIYDYVGLIKELNDITKKLNLLNTFFKTKIIILAFEKLSPTDEYLLKNCFKNIANVDIKICNVSSLFNENYLFISGNYIFHNNKKIKKLNKGKYILVGNSDCYDDILKKLENKFNVNILEHENSLNIIYDIIS